MEKVTIEGLLKENPDLTISETVKKLLEKLDYYQHLEEQGMLFKTPCKIYQKLYTIQAGKIEEYTVVGFSFTGDFYKLYGEMLIWLEWEFNGKTYSRNINSNKLGVDWFLTKEEVKVKLTEVKKDESKIKSFVESFLEGDYES